MSEDIAKKNFEDMYQLYKHYDDRSDPLQGHPPLGSYSKRMPK